MKEMPKLIIDHTKGQEEPNGTTATPLALVRRLVDQVISNRPQHKGAPRKTARRICQCGYSKPPFRELCYRCKPPSSQVSVYDGKLCSRCKKNERDFPKQRYCKECRLKYNKAYKTKHLPESVPAEETGEP